MAEIEGLARELAEHRPLDMGNWVCCAADYCSHDGNGEPWPCPIRQLADVLEDLCRAFIMHRTATHEVTPSDCKTCARSDAAIESAADLLKAMAEVTDATR